jgi:hypothetical protein
MAAFQPADEPPISPATPVHLHDVWLHLIILRLVRSARTPTASASPLAQARTQTTTSCSAQMGHVAQRSPVRRSAAPCWRPNRARGLGWMHGRCLWHGGGAWRGRRAAQKVPILPDATRGDQGILAGPLPVSRPTMGVLSAVAVAAGRHVP